MKRRSFLQSAAALAAAPALQSLLNSPPRKTCPPLRRAQPLPTTSSGHGHRRVSGRRRRSRRRPRSLRLGYLLPHAWQNLPGPDRRCRRRLLPPLPARHRADAASRHEGFPLLHRMPRIFPDGTARPTPKASTSTSASSTPSWPPTSSPSAPSSTGIYPRHSRTKAAGPAAPPLRAFADYAHYTVSQLSDRISHWMTINEFGSFIDAGYGEGVSAPGLRLPRARLCRPVTTPSSLMVSLSRPFAPRPLVRRSGTCSGHARSHARHRRPRPHPRR